MTRVALLPSSYPPSLGGVEELTRHLALSLRAAGDEVEVWTGHPDDGVPETVEILDGIVVRRLPMPLPATHWSAVRRSAVTGTRSLLSLRSAVAAFRPDVLHVQCFGPNGVYAHALSRLTGLPLVVTLQGETLMDDTDIFDASRVLRTSLRAALRTAAAVTGCSAFTLADAEKRFGLAPGRGRVIPNGVDLFEAGTGPSDVHSNGRSGPFATVQDGPDGPYILALGRVVEKKGFDLLLAAYAALDETARTADLVVGGQGEAMAGLRHTASALGITDRVHFVGRLSRQEVAEAMAGATLFVMPSRLEPFGIVILEAWRAGAPVVATNRGGPPEFVRDGNDGVLVDPFDTTAFACVLESLLLDPDRRRRVGDAGYLRVRSFGWVDIAERYREVYSSVAGPRGAGARPLDEPLDGRPLDDRPLDEPLDDRPLDDRAPAHQGRSVR
ncbi:MAG: glycosyltransferase family 4 protein [Acidimicrobiales bacterium]|jgi:phosphatidylinositol alpha-mannosyltransferase/D-inositol-3-phosphate glycosyltransferase